MIKNFMISLAVVAASVVGSAQGPVVAGFDAVAGFDHLTVEQKETAAAKRFLYVDRSVGVNINEGITCLGGLYVNAKNGCKRYLHVVPEFNNVPETWDGAWPRTNITFFSWDPSPGATVIPCGLVTGNAAQKMECFEVYVESTLGQYDIVMYLPSYLDYENADAYVQKMIEIRNNTGLEVWLATSSLPRMAEASITNYNNRVRELATLHGFKLYDLAAVISRNQFGVQAFDNRDGVPYVTPSCSENYPDDGIAYEAISQAFTRECGGGHLGNPDAGKIRAAKALWWLLAQ